MKSHLYLIALLSISFPWVLNASEQPNFLFLLSDDQAWTGLSCQMHPDMPDSKSRVIETPNIARLAGEGMRFSAAYSPASVCAPTRISLQTGKSPAQCQWTKAAGSVTEADGFKLIGPQNRRSIEASETTIGELLQSAGYTTAHFGKWHISGGGPEQHGYDESDGDTANEAAAPFLPPNPVDIFGMGERAMNVMTKSAQAKKPFFIQMSYHALHYPQNAPPELVKKYQKLIPGGNEKEVGRSAMSEALDQGVGQLLEKIESLGIADNTYVIYMSDNGSSTKQTLRGGKGGVWEGGVRVPLIVRGPGIAANSWSHQRVVGYDFYPTFCELAGVQKDLPDTIEGGSITHLFRGENKPVERPREELVFHFPHYQGDTPHSALLLDNWKIMHFYETGETHLFDLADDIAERRDLAEQKPEIADAMKQKLFAYLSEVDAQMPLKNPSYDPDNPPSADKMRGGKNGGGGKKGQGGGGKKKRMSEESDTPENTESDADDSDSPDNPGTAEMEKKKGKGGGKGGKRTTEESEEPATPSKTPNSAPVSGGSAIDLNPAAFQRIAVGGTGGLAKKGNAPGDTGSWVTNHAGELDTNGDGSVSQNELMSQARMAFHAFDADQNGVLSSAEYEGKNPKMAVAGFLTSNTTAVDANSDSIITAQEFASALRSAFEEADSDKDGSIATE
ncbi:MAG: sulfatase-like hydrolase/transferase [Verrucomicrobiales bacterium]|nr:sulfatase-like hydrolase/transferase [Verrucomicrobiales bacterium]